MSEHEKTLTNLSSRLSIYRGHHGEKEKRYLATYNCLIEKQRQETLQLQQQILNKESKKKSNKTGPRLGSRSVKKTSTPNSAQQQSFIPEKVKKEEEDQPTTVITLAQPHLPNNNFVNINYQPPEPQVQQCQPQLTHHNHQHNPNHLHQQQLQIQQLEQHDSQSHQFQQFQHSHNNFHNHNQYVQPYQQPSLDLQHNLAPQTQSHQYQTHHNIYNHNHHYIQSQHSQQPQLQPTQNVQQRHQHPKLQYQQPINHGNYYQQEFKELKDEDLACLDSFHNAAELPLSGFSQTYEQEIFLDQNFIEKFLDNI